MEKIGGASRRLYYFLFYNQFLHKFYYQIFFTKSDIRVPPYEILKNVNLDLDLESARSRLKISRSRLAFRDRDLDLVKFRDCQPCGVAE